MRRPPSLGRVPVAPVPRRPQYYAGATTPCTVGSRRSAPALAGVSSCFGVVPTAFAYVGASVQLPHSYVSSPRPSNRTCRFTASGSHPGSCPSPTEGFARSVAAGAARSPALVRGAHVSPAPTGRRGAATGKAARPFPTAPLFPLSRPPRAATPFASACGTLWTLRTLSGGTRLSPLSTAPSSFLRHSQTKAPSLHPHYQVSPLLRAHPPPCRPKLALAGSRLARAPHRQGFPCCCFLPLPCVLAPIPRRMRVGACVARFPTRQRPSPGKRRVGFRISLFEACSAFTSRSGPQGLPRRPSVDSLLLPASTPSNIKGKGASSQTVRRGGKNRTSCGSTPPIPPLCGANPMDGIARRGALRLANPSLGMSHSPLALGLG